MKILVYGQQKLEKKYVKEWQELNPEIEVIALDETINLNNAEHLKDAQGISIKQSKPFDKDLYPLLKNYGIQHISTRTAGMDVFDFNLAKENNIELTSTSGYAPEAVAEYSVMLGLMALRQYKRTNNLMLNNDFTVYENIIGKSVKDLNVAVLGLGHIGFYASKLWKGMGANVLGYSRSKKDKYDGVLTHYTDLDSILEDADLISLHLPLNEHTHHLINKDKIDLMKEGSFIVNTGRGGVLDTQALIDGIKAGKLAGAGLDVIEDELGYNYRKDVSDDILEKHFIHELNKLDNVIVTQHIAYLTEEALRDMVFMSLDSVKERIKK